MTVLDRGKCLRIRERYEAGGETLKDLGLAYGVAPSTIRNALRRHFRKTLWEGADYLPWEHDTIAHAVVARYARLTLREVGLVMGITRERTRQVERSALRKLRAAHGDKALREMLEAWRELREERDERARLEHQTDSALSIAPHCMH